MITALFRRLYLAPLPSFLYATTASISLILSYIESGATWHYVFYFILYFTFSCAILSAPYIPLIYIFKKIPRLFFGLLFLCLACSIFFSNLRIISFMKITDLVALNDPGLRNIYAGIVVHSYFSIDTLLCIIIILSMMPLLLARHTRKKTAVKFMNISSTLIYMLWPLLFFALTYSNGLLESAIYSLPSIFIFAYLERKHFTD